MTSAYVNLFREAQILLTLRKAVERIHRNMCTHSTERTSGSVPSLNQGPSSLLEGLFLGG